MSENCAIILAGGQGKRIKSDLPKPMLKVLGKPMLGWVIDACEDSQIRDICIVKGFNGEVIENYINGRYKTVFQKERLGTGHAVMQCKQFLTDNLDGDTLVLCGDAPFIDDKTIYQSLEFHKVNSNSVTVISAYLEDNKGYGRIVRENDKLSEIVEEKDCNTEEKLIKEINSGAYWFKTRDLLESLNELSTDNIQGEYYLTDTIKILKSKGKNVDAYLTDNEFVAYGANDRMGMLTLNRIANQTEIERHLQNGVEFTNTDGITIEKGVKIGKGTYILQGSILKEDTVIGEGCEIGPNCIIGNTTVGNNTKLNYVQAFDSKIEDNVKIGPFVHIRPNSHIKSGVKIGDFVEVKNSTIGESTAVAHLTYVGDSDVGKHVNFGCGCVTVNYDGAKKARCTIGDEAFIGCNTNLIAPVKVGNGAYTAAGTTVTKDVPDNALALDRGEFRIKEGYALRKLRARKEK